MNRIRRWICAAALALPVVARAQQKPGAPPIATTTQPSLKAAPPSPAGIEFFESKIRPVLVEQCYRCHSAQAPKLKAKLRLDTAEGILKGGESDLPAIVPKNLDDSTLIRAIRWEDEGLQMPPKKKLPENQIAAFETWVKLGAPMPASAKPAALAAGQKTPAPQGPLHGLSLAEGRKFWSFIPPHLQPVPASSKPVQWAHTDIDRFILARLDEKKLTPSAPADKRTLIRRATYDLIGLPPTPAEVDAFEKDTSADAFAKVVDRLLASPHYGERWGRYWLDVARYADTKGYVFQEERRYAFSYTYRDWVIRALNQDLPYDQFLIQQIAADRLESSKTDKSQLAALGFLTLGRRFLNNQSDIIDDRIDVVCRGTMALTVSCARCHDHKYDPIPTADYYSLYGVFASSQEPAELPLIAPPSTQPTAFSIELAKRRAELEAFLKPLTPEQLAQKPNQDRKRELQQRIDEWIASSPDSPPRAMAIEDLPAPVEPHIFIRGNAQNPGKQVPRQLPAILCSDDRKPFTNGSGRLELARDIASKSNPLTARVMVNRVWQYHFGYGLVRTPSDFGTRGDPPTHPKLLDWLALRFVNEDGWSLKKLHREIMLSAAYQQASVDRPDARAIDPENKLLWRMNPRRLDFEALRDSLLAASGQIDLTLGGRSVDITSEPFTLRRTVYAFIDRQNLPGLFRTFDFASPDSTSGMRFTTSVPQQALFMMNSPFVIEQAKKLAARAEVTREKQPGQRVAALYRLLFGRAPDETESRLGVQFIKSERTQPADAILATAPAWQYGYGEFDEATGRIKSFTPMPHFSKDAWQGGDALPDPKLGWATLNARGGHVGNDVHHAVIRRWIAPRDCTIAIAGKLVHPQKEGDGVRARIVSSREGLLAQWIVHHKSADIRIDQITLHQGDSIDFMVDCGRNGDYSFDGFQWSVTVTKQDSPEAVAGDDAGRTWDSAAEFAGPLPARPKPLGAWEKYAQVLLESNEFAFVD
jgi:hypothetical protein